jgi:hypothetical protein
MLQNITPSPQELTMQLNVQKQLNEELRISCHEQEQRLKDVHLENVHMQALQFKRLMDEDENQRNVDLLLKAELTIRSLRIQYDEDMLEVQGLAKVLQERILSLQAELADVKTRNQVQEHYKPSSIT